jgi:tellurite resistance-related uncharacterized protein
MTEPTAAHGWGDVRRGRIQRLARYARFVERTITGYHQDEAGDWVAQLSCGHNQHIRHQPPFQLRAWVLEPDGRAGRLGSPIDCALCDRAELPDSLRLVRSSLEWNAQSVPAALLRAHRLASGMWGRIAVHEGQLRFVASTEPALDIVCGPGTSQAIPPDVEHEVELRGTVRFTIDFLAIDESRRTEATHEAVRDALQSRVPAEGGDSACWAGLLCPECGAVLDGGPHRPDCPAAEPRIR